MTTIPARLVTLYPSESYPAIGGMVGIRQAIDHLTRFMQREGEAVRVEGLDKLKLTVTKTPSEVEYLQEQLATLTQRLRNHPKLTVDDVRDIMAP